MPTYRRCNRCKQDMAPQPLRVCPSCYESNPTLAARNTWRREFDRKRREDPAFKAAETARLREHTLRKPVEERRRYAREVMQRWRDVPENAATLVEREHAISVEVLLHYGGVCACCGEDAYKALSIDHPENNGADHRRSINKTPFRRWLKAQGFPPGYRVLCMNCNFARGRFGTCHHEDERDGREVERLRNTRHES
jgi:hypothetical protein